MVDCLVVEDLATCGMSPLLSSKVTAQDLDQFVRRILAFGPRKPTCREVFANVALKHLAKQAGDSAANSGNLLQYLSAIFVFVQRALNGVNLAADASQACFELLAITKCMRHLSPPLHAIL
jgi:hypothetical protein